MDITLIPFVTALLAEYLGHPGERAAAVYSAACLLMAVFFNLLWRRAADGGRLLADDRDPHKVRRITEQYRFGPLLYGAALALAFVSVPLCLGLNLLLAVFFALPERPARTP
jgi:uncharacterized membrane protein